MISFLFPLDNGDTVFLTAGVWSPPIGSGEKARLGGHTKGLPPTFLALTDPKGAL